MVTILRAWVLPTWTRWLQTWMPPAARYFPLHARRPDGWGWEWSGEAGVAEPVTLLGRDRGGHGPGQHAVDDQVQQLPVEAQGDPAAGVLEPDRDRGSGQGDHADAIGGAVDLDR